MITMISLPLNDSGLGPLRSSYPLDHGPRTLVSLLTYYRSQSDTIHFGTLKDIRSCTLLSLKFLVWSNLMGYLG
jgi:hypothetical protein